MRIKELQKFLKKKKINFALFINLGFDETSYNSAYFSGYNGVGALIIPSKEKPFLIVPKMELEKARKCGFRVYTPEKTRFFDFMREKARENKIGKKRIAVDKEELSLLYKDYIKKSFRNSRLVDIRKYLYKLREQKTEIEIKTIKEAYRISDRILKNCFSRFKSFKTESDVSAFLEFEARKYGCETSFPPIVASGKHSSQPHYWVENKKLRKGFCLIDFGIRYKNYCTDTTRMVYLGEPSEEEIRIYNFLLKVQKNIIRNLRVGKRCERIYKEAVGYLGNYSKYFTHGLGHGFGIKIHELPNITEKSKDKIKENTVFTIEPGIYLKNFGIRIEDGLLSNKNKIEILSKLPKDLLIVN